MLSFVGKFLVAAALCFQAWLLFSNTAIIAEFDVKLGVALTTCSCIPANISALILQHGRLVMVGLLGTSALMVVMRCWLIKVLVILALSAQLYLEHQPFNKIPNLNNIQLWTQVALIGGLIYIMGSDCAGSCATKPKPQEKPAAKPQQ
jgi:hypothetical protein